MRHDFASLSELYNYSTKVYASRPVAQFVDGSQKYTFAEFGDTCRNLSKRLQNFGINSNDKIAILSQNMPNWTVAFFAITAFGRIAVPILNEMTEPEITSILLHSEAKAIFVSRKLFPRLSDKVLEQMSLVICTDDLSIMKANDEKFTCDGTISNPLSDDIAAIIYTSGTTGTAKGVMLSHRNLCANVLEAWHAQKVRRRDVFLSILPMAHTYEMSIAMLYPFSVGACVYYITKAPTPSVLMDALKKVRPTCMLSVPLIIEKIYRSSIIPTIEKSRFLKALNNFSPKILCLLVGVKLKKTFGGRIKFFGIGGAKLDPEVERFLHRARFPYAIGYGLTETAPLICNASPFKTCVGSTGIAAHGVQIRLENVDPVTGQGELVVKGDNVMRGYYKDYTRTESVLSADGWFHTGDIATKDKKNRYYIKGRLGSLILGPSGENIYPEEIETVLNNYKDVNESLVIERNGHLIALVQFNDNVLDWNLEGQDKFVEMLEDRKKAILDYVNKRVRKSSNIQSIEIQKEPFVKTATHKIKRFLYNGDRSTNG